MMKCRRGTGAPKHRTAVPSRKLILSLSFLLLIPSLPPGYRHRQVQQEVALQLSEWDFNES